MTRGPKGAGAANLSLGRDVLLFFEDRDPDTFVRGDRRLRRMLRKGVGLLRPNRQRVSGFEISFRLLRKALTDAGQRVHVNDFALARRHPDFPVGLCGYSQILDDWALPNPAVVGPGMYDHPKQNIGLLDDRRYAAYIVFCNWMRDMFGNWYERDRLFPWFGGIDVNEWPTAEDRLKDIDVIVYDKIRWNRETLEPGFREPLLDELRRRGLRFEILRYGSYTLGMYRKLLKRSRSLLFLCEHETQGMAYQEAMASDLPVLAWDQGSWIDPNSSNWEANAVPATSVPYFSDECGERFNGLEDFPVVLDRFLERLPEYKPRAWVAAHLSPEESAALYLRAYHYAAGGT
jgi:hypothetical protein